jgi:hypothetical protein
METERDKAVAALRARRASRGVNDPLNRMRAGMAASDAPRVVEEPAPHVVLYQAGFDAERAGVKWWENPHEGGSVEACHWDAGHTGARRLRAAQGIKE